MKVVGNIYAYLWPGVTVQDMLSYGNNCNSYVVSNSFTHKGKTTHILIDPGQMVNEVGIKCLERLLGEMEKDGILVKDIGLVINTHSHNDHCEAGQFFKEKGALIAMSQEEEVFLETAGKGLCQMFGVEPPRFTVDMYLKEGELNFHNLKLEVFLTAGHSPGSVSLYLPDFKVLISGDVIFYGSTGRTDLPGGDGNLLKASIDRLSQLGTELILTGHQYQAPGIIEGKDNIRKNFDFIRQYVFPYL